MQASSAARAIAWGLAAIVSAGCATQGDLVQQERKLASMFDHQARSLAALSREVAQLRADLEGGAKGPSDSPLSPDEAERATQLEQRVEHLEERRAAATPIGMTLSPEGTSSEDSTATEQTMAALSARAAESSPSEPGAAAMQPSTAPHELAALPRAPAATPPLRTGAGPPPPAPGPKVAIDDDWKREVAQDRAVASTTGGVERSAYLSALDSLAMGDCSTARSRLDSLSGNSASPLADNALYWKARCAAHDNANEAVSSLRALVAHYPKSDKAPAALWEESQLLIRLGDVPSARVALSKLIHAYPSTGEATQARRKLTEVEH